MAEQMRTIEADFRAMKVTLDDSLSLQSRLQNLLEDERPGGGDLCPTCPQG